MWNAAGRHRGSLAQRWYAGRPRSVRLVSEAPSVVHAVSASLRMAGHGILAVSAALPPGSMWGRTAKVGQAVALTRELRDLEGPAMIGMDRNGPKFERWEADRTSGGRKTLGTSSPPTHPTAARTFSNCGSGRTRAPLTERGKPHRTEPMQISYVEQRADPPIPRRYDVLTNSAFEVLDVRYPYAEAVEAGSDHGLVEAHLRMTEWTGPSR